MKLETASAVSAAAAAGGVSIVTGTLLGLPVASIVGGFIGAVFAMSSLPPSSTLVQRAVTLLGSTAAGAIVGPVVAPLILSALPEGSKVQSELLMGSGGIVVGFSVQAVLSAMSRRIIKVVAGGAENEQR